ncbi:cytochrome c oxidase subunit I [Rubeoparvulum massiliense]|uniref:cytochrome c oxidase subunit I n=1 Tax=Rubeoparvulum massiliense TaxID=1631346 RepID=UPI00065DD705|nr:cytochrome c oxidase subunit I [Rubeoparvulum massiliense]
MTTLANKRSGLWDWLTTVDHKKIGIMYFLAGFFFFALAGIEALLMRIQLMYPLFDFVDSSTFNQLFSMHGTTMLFLAATPILFGFMNYMIPLQIGARDVAFPFLNALGFWLFLFGGVLLNISWFFGTAPEAGWTSYVPIAISYEPGHWGTNFYVLGLQISGFGTLMSAINFLVTILNMRAPGMSLMRMPMFVWTAFVSSGLILFAFPALTAGLFMLMYDSIFNSAFFDVNRGGNVILYQHIFWIFGHPEVYLLVLPAFGIFSEVIPTFSRKRLFGYHSMVFATMLIGFLGFMVWVHHMFTVGMGPVANAIFAIATMAIAVPTGIKVFNWLFTLWGGQIRFTTANLFALAFIPTFVMGGVTGVMLSVPGADYQFHDSYFVVAHFHYVLIGGVVFAIFSAIFYWWPKMFGYYLNELLGKIFFVIFFIGFHMTFLIQHFLGLWGMPRRNHTYLPDQGLDTGNFVSTIGTILMAIGVTLLVINIVYSTAKKKKAPADAWEDGRSMEWALSSPPPFYNFAQSPLVKGQDNWWLEKRAGNKSLTPAEPLGEVHMPNNSILPMIISIGLFISGFGFIFHQFAVAIAGLVLTFLTMTFRSLKDDHGHHLSPEELNEGGQGR